MVAGIRERPCIYSHRIKSPTHRPLGRPHSLCIHEPFHARSVIQERALTSRRIARVCALCDPLRVCKNAERRGGMFEFGWWWSGFGRETERERERDGCMRRMVYFKTFIVVYFLSSGDDTRLLGFRCFPHNLWPPPFLRFASRIYILASLFNLVSLFSRVVT